MIKIIIFGTGDIAQIANFYFETDSNYEVVAFTVDKLYLIDNEFEGKPVIPFEEIINSYPPDRYKMFIAISYKSMNKIREEKYLQSKKMGYELVSYVSSRCTYLSQFSCGDNCFIFEDNTIQPFVKIGNNVTIWSGNHIGHHSEIWDNNFISSHVVISGHCKIKNNCFLGVNSTLHNNIEIEKETLIAAGAIVSKSTKPKNVILPVSSSVFNKNSDEINF